MEKSLRNTTSDECVYKPIFESANDGILIIEANNLKFKMANKAMARMLGYNIEEFFDLKTEDLQTETSVFDGLKHGLLQDVALKKKDGSIIYVDVNKTIVYVKGKKCLLGIYRDTTYLHKLQTLTVTTEAKYASILRVAPIGIGLIFNRIITLASDKLCEMAGYSREELLGQDARILCPDKEEYIRVGKKVFSDIRKYGIGKVETFWERKDGKLIDIDLRFTPIYADDLSAGITFTALDITKRKQAEKRGEFLLTLLSHDLKNKMHIINGYLKILTNTGLSESQLTMVRKALGACDASNKLIEKVVMLKEIGKNDEREIVSIEPLVTAAVSRIYDKAVESGITISLEPISGNVLGGSLLEECFYNILENSVKHANCTVIRISHVDVGDRLKIVFEDNGRGIANDVLKNIFVRGIKGTHSNGLGLGTFLIHQIITDYGGTIDVSSSSLEGTKFYIYLRKI